MDQKSKQHQIHIFANIGYTPKNHILEAILTHYLQQ